MSVRQGTLMSHLLESRGAPWNSTWNGGPAQVSGRDLPVVELAGGLRLTLLSPREAELNELARHWDRALEKMPPDSEVRGSSTTRAPDPAEQDSSVIPERRPARVLLVHANEDRAMLDHVRAGLEASVASAVEFFASGDRAPASESLADIRSSLGDDIAEADGALLLVSPAFLASDWINEVELPLLLESAQRGDLFLTWILLEDCDLQKSPVAEYQAAQEVLRPLSRMDEKVRHAVISDVGSLLMKTLGQTDEATKSASTRAREVPSGTVDVEKLANAPFTGDDSVSNGASIAFLAEFGDSALLVGGDARSEVLEDSIRQLLRQRGERKLALSAFVIPHNGSERNLSLELLGLLECDRFLISTNGARFRHPDRTTIARIIAHGSRSGRPPTLIFNYRSKHAEIWSDRKLQARYGYKAVYPESNAGVRIEI